MTTLQRSELIQITDRASVGITESTRAKLLSVAATTSAVAVGWFHCNGVKCPTSQAGRRNQAFQEAFDAMMCVRLEIDRNPEAEWPTLPVEPFVVTIIDGAT